MKTLLKYTGLFFGLLLVLNSCGESLEDTYKEYAGDGEIRYVGVCSDATIAPGWQRLILNWTNNIDPIITGIKVVWTLDDVKKGEIILARGTTEYSIPNLEEDGTYAVTICSVDKDGNESASVTNYCRPYCLDHEEIKAFTLLVSKHFYIKARLQLFFSDLPSSILEV